MMQEVIWEGRDCAQKRGVNDIASMNETQVLGQRLKMLVPDGASDSKL